MLITYWFWLMIAFSVHSNLPINPLNANRIGVQNNDLIHNVLPQNTSYDNDISKFIIGKDYYVSYIENGTSTIPKSMTCDSV